MRELTERETYLDDYLLASTAETIEEVERLRQQAASLSSGGASTGQIAVFNGSEFVPGTFIGDGNGLSVVVTGPPTGLQATLSQDLKITASPTFAGLTISGLADVGNLKVGAETIKRIDYGTVAADPGSITAQQRGSVDVTITGVAVGDIVIMNPPDALNAGLVFGGCRVTGANTVRIYLANLTGLAIDDGSNTYDYLWIDLT